jgi:hypothetical protein
VATVQERPVRIGHTDLGITSIYLKGIDGSEIIDAVHPRPAQDCGYRLTTRRLTATVARPHIGGSLDDAAGVSHVRAERDSHAVTGRSPRPGANEVVSRHAWVSGQTRVSGRRVSRRLVAASMPATLG